MYLNTIIATHVCNVVFNWLLIYGNLGFPKWGAFGAGVASSASSYIASILFLLVARKRAKEHGFATQRPDPDTLATTRRLWLPSGTERVLYVAYVFGIFWIMGKIGKPETAATAVLINIAILGNLLASAIGVSAGSLAGQALGRKDPDDAKRWGFDAVKLAVIAVVILSIPQLIVPDYVLRLFVKDAQALELARAPLVLYAATMVFDGICLALHFALLGLGAGRQVLVLSVSLQWFALLPAAYVVGITFGEGLWGIWVAFTVYRAARAILFVGVWMRGKWKHARA